MNDARTATFTWDALPERYRLILCDIWGVVHNGVRLNPGAADRLRSWRQEGRTVVLITNAPRPAEAVREQLDRMGLSRDCWDSIVTSGEAGVAALLSLGAPVGFLGTAEDRSILSERGLRFSEEEFSDVACVGLEEGRQSVQEYRDQLSGWAARGVRLHCLNPDRVVMRGGATVICAGALADLYLDLGGSVIWYGKPYRPIYDHALRTGGNPPVEDVLAVGDGLLTDMLGAAQLGIDAVYVLGGIHEHEPFPADFAKQHGLGDWRPLASVEGL